MEIGTPQYHTKGRLHRSIRVLDLTIMLVFAACSIVSASGAVATPAPRVAITQETEAIAYTRHFFKQEYVNIGPVRSVDVVYADGEWHATAHFLDGLSDAALRFDNQAVITGYSHLATIGETTDSPITYMESTINADVYSFVNNFAKLTLPGISFETITLKRDFSDGKARYLQFYTSNNTAAAAHQFIVQVEPTLRILAFELMADKALAVYGEPDADTAMPGNAESLAGYVGGIMLTKGPWLMWPLPDKAELSARMPLLLAQYKDHLGNMGEISSVWSHAHGIPSEKDISLGDALSAAQTALAERFAVSFADFEGLTPAYSYYIDDPNRPVFDVHLLRGGTIRYSVQIDARTAKTVSIYDALAPRVTPTPPPAGGVPGPEVIAEEAAIDLARQALVDKLQLTSIQADQLLIAKVEYLTYHKYWMSHGVTRPFWYIGFVRKEFEKSRGMEYLVILDAVTGRLFVIHDPTNISNG